MASEKKLTLRDTVFVDLMQRRIFNVLIVANPYDAFMLEDDGRVDEKIFSEYTKLGLRFPPRFIQVASSEEAEATIARTGVNLIICMPGTGNSSIFDIARGIKNNHPTIPIVILTPFSHGITSRTSRPSNTSSAGWATRSCCSPSSSSSRTA